MSPKRKIVKDVLESILTYTVIVPVVCGCCGLVYLCSGCRPIRGFCGTRQPTPEDRERARAKAKARILEEQPSALPTFRRNISTSSLSQSQQLSCPFLRLPLELRRRIYEYTLGGNMIHLTHIAKGIIRQRNPSRDRLNYWGSGSVVETNGPEDHETSIPQEGDQPEWKNILSLLKACRTIYAEAIPFLYNRNTFSMFSPLVLIYMQDLTLRPQRFAQIRHLQFLYKYLPTMFLDVFPPDDPETWARVWDIVAGMRLRTLDLQLYVVGEPDSIDAGWVQPLLKVSGVQKTSISIYLPNGPNRERASDLEQRIKEQWSKPRDLLSPIPSTR